MLLTTAFYRTCRLVRCNRFLVSVFTLGLRRRERPSPFATKRTNSVEGSSYTSDCRCNILILQLSCVAFILPSFTPHNLCHRPFIQFASACEELRLVCVPGCCNPFSQMFAENFQPNSWYSVEITLPLLTHHFSGGNTKTYRLTTLQWWGGAITPPLLHAFLECTESLNCPLAFPNTLCFFSTSCVTELIKNFPTTAPLYVPSV
jgi:hypothetical protein